MNKTTVNISCGLLNEILTLFIFLLRFLYVTLSYKQFKTFNYERHIY